MNKALLFIVIYFSFAPRIYAQDFNSSETPILDGFTTLIEKSNDYQGYKVVDYNDLVSLKKNTLEFISFLKNEITTQENSIDQQKDEILELKRGLETTEQNLADVTAEKDAITFLGMPFSKGSYMALMWGIVAALIIALLFFIFRFKKGNIQTTEAKKNLLITENEFEAYRAKALEKEQRLGRLLQDERNRASDK
jgi:hypothetical protein